MKLSSFVNFEAPESIDLGDIIVLSHKFKKETYTYLVCGVPVKDGAETTNEYEKYQLVYLNTGKVVYEINTDEHELFELWEYFDDFALNREYNQLLVGHNNIIISFEVDKKY